MLLKTDSLFIWFMFSLAPMVGMMHRLEIRDLGKLRARLACTFAPGWYVSRYWKIPVTSCLPLT
jgi:hypothetical protein